MTFNLNNTIWKLDIPFSELGDYYRKRIQFRSRTTLVTGTQGSGKSISAASLCMEIDPDFSELNMCWDMDSFYEKVDKLVELNKTYSVMIADDFGSEADAYDFINQGQKNLNHLLEKYRTLHLGLFITVPNERFITKNIRDRIADYKMYVLGHNEYLGFAKANLFKLAFRRGSDKPDERHLYAFHNGPVLSSYQEKIVNGVKYCPLKVITWDIPRPPPSFEAWYNPFRKKLGENQFKKSKSAHELDQSQKKKGTREQIEIDAKKIMENETKYIKTWRGEQILNVELVKAEFGFSDKYGRVLNAFIKEKYLKD